MGLGTTTSLSTWNTSNNCVERLTDNIPYTSAHPDDALVLVGPPRYSGADLATHTYPIGLLQQFTYSQGRQVAPMQTIGSGRAYFSVGKSTVNFNMGRLFVKGPNLLRALYKSAEKQGIVIKENIFGERPVSAGAPNFAINLDSELFLIPFGILIHYRDKTNNPMGAVYLENCVLISYQTGLTAGQAMIMESVAGMADRLFSVEVDSEQSGFPTGSPWDDSPTSKEITKNIFGHANDGIEA